MVFDREDFRVLIGRIRAGDEHAAAELVQKYEPLIRREVRLHLEDRRMRRTFDSMDIVQSVLASFFHRDGAKEFDLDNPQQLVGLLVRMARNKLASAVRKQYCQRRDTRRTEVGCAAIEKLPSDDPTASAEAANQEILEALRNELTAEERQIASLRAEGLSWNEIAATLGKKPQALRMQLTRGIERASRILGLAELYE